MDRTPMTPRELSSADECHEHEKSDEPENRRRSIRQFRWWAHDRRWAALVLSSVPPEKQAVAVPQKEATEPPRDSYEPAAWINDTLFRSLELQFRHSISRLNAYCSQTVPNVHTGKANYLKASGIQDRRELPSGFTGTY